MSTMEERARKYVNKHFEAGELVGRHSVIHTAATFARSELERAGVPETYEEAAFLLERLDEWSNEHLTDSNARDWIGHVQPSIERLHIALRKTDGSKP